MRPRLWVRFGCVVICGLLGGACVRTPPLETPTSIPIKDVVRRVQCDMISAFADRIEGKKNAGFDWLKGWTAQVDLNLRVDQTAGITPAASFIHPLATDTVPLVGMVQRNFALGVAGGLNTTATRNETVSFTLSLKELLAMRDKNQKKWHNLYSDCLLPNNRDLDSELGLAEWIDSALSPATGEDDDHRFLTKGNHKPPKAGGSASSAKKASVTVAATAKAMVKTEEFKSLLQKNDDLSKAWAKFEKDNGDLSTFLNADKKPPQKLIKTVLDDIKSVLQLCDCASDSPLRRQILSLTKCLQDLQATLNALQPAPLDPPIDSISHQIIFIVTASTSITPSWTLVHFKGPVSGSGNLAGISETDTHTLTISMGPAGSPDVTAQKNSLAISAGIANALRVPAQ
jgi:hypothetical protein